MLLHQRFASVGRGCGSGRCQLTEVGGVVLAAIYLSRTEAVGWLVVAIRASAADVDLYARCRLLRGSQRHERAVLVKLVRFGPIEQALPNCHLLLVALAPGIEVEKRETELVQHDWVPVGTVEELEEKVGRVVGEYLNCTPDAAEAVRGGLKREVIGGIGHPQVDLGAG